jgi:phosphate transport system permease protein
MNSKLSLRQIKTSIFQAFCLAATLLAIFALGMILWSLFSQGLAGLSLDIITMDTPAPDTRGGLRNAIVGSLIMCAIAMVIAMIIGILAGTWLSEYGGQSRYATLVRFLNDVLLSAPSILIGLCVYEAMVKPFGGFSALAGAVALAIIALPIITRTTEDMLRLQPNALREAGMAIGASQFKTIVSIIWSAARAGLLTGALLAFARISGETAPLLFTALGSNFFSLDLTAPMSSLPSVMNTYAMSPFDDWVRLAWTAALIVAVSVLSINIIGRYLLRQPTSK